MEAVVETVVEDTISAGKSYGLILLSAE